MAAPAIGETERTASKERTRGSARLRMTRTKREVTGSCRNVALSKGDNGGAKPPKNAGWRAKRQSRKRKEPVMDEGITFVGLDAHKASISVSMLLPNVVTPLEWQLPNEASAVRRMVRRIEREAPGEVRTCYEAGPCAANIRVTRRRRALSRPSSRVPGGGTRSAELPTATTP